MKILLISDHYPPFIGGAHRQTQLLAHELQQRGHVVNVITVWSGGLLTQENDDGVNVTRLKQVRTVLPIIVKDRKQRHQPPYPDPITIVGLRRHIARFKPDIIHAYGWFGYSTGLALLGSNIPLLISARDYGYSCATRTLVYRGKQICDGPNLIKCLGCSADLYGGLKGWIAALSVWAQRPLLKRKVQGIHSISTYVQHIIRRDFLRLDADSIAKQSAPIAEAIIPSFREDDLHKRYDDRPYVQSYLAKLPSEKFILYVGALRRVKGVDQLLEAYSTLTAPPPLVLIGTREADSPTNIPKGVVILDGIPHDAVMAAWERSLFGVIPSLWPEPLGSVVYEGMSRGKAVIGTTPGGHTDMIIPNETGLLVPSGDVPALAQAMASLLSQPEWCQQLGKAAKERARLYTASVVIPQFEQLYQYVIEQSKSSGSHAHVSIITSEP